MLFFTSNYTDCSTEDFVRALGAKSFCFPPSSLASNNFRLYTDNSRRIIDSVLTDIIRDTKVVNAPGVFFFMLALLISVYILMTFRNDLKWILRGMHKSNICYRRRFPCNPPLLSINMNFNFADFCHKKYVIKRRGCHFTCIMHWNASATSLPVLYIWDSCIKQWS